ncbi:MAG TPA: heme-binding protein [Candidatus Dormibacteraeota bacterium]|nr:heme-binding protein [Candidatus Dormibacteraeota bacterium]
METLGTSGPLSRQRKLLVIGCVLALSLAVLLVFLLVGCGGSTELSPVFPPASSSLLTVADVQTVVQNAAQAASPTAMVIAVVDRAGRVLAVYRKPAAPISFNGNFGALVNTNDLAVALARSAAFFSNDQAPLSSRTVRYISGIHFPPGVSNAPNAALYGIENTNRGCPLTSNFLPGQSVPTSRNLDGSPGLGIITGKANILDSDSNAVNPGGVPLFKNGKLAGGIGVTGVSTEVAEFTAFSAAVASGFGPSPASPGVVVIDGVSLPFVNQTTLPPGTGPGVFDGSFLVGPLKSEGPPPDGDLIAPTVGVIGGLTVTEVKLVLDNAENTANTTRAAIRLPLSARTRMVIAVADLNGSIIGLRRMADSTVFSIDVAVAKARNMIYFNSASRTPMDLPGIPKGTAITNRTISFGSQPLFPPGINGSEAGPFFNLYKIDLANPCTQGFDPATANQNGIVFFPGSVPLYRSGVLVGGLGVSGDGVDQDDFVSSGGAAGFEAPASIRADQISVGSVRLPYLKFPRNPTD